MNDFNVHLDETDATKHTFDSVNWSLTSTITMLAAAPFRWHLSLFAVFCLFTSLKRPTFCLTRQRVYLHLSLPKRWTSTTAAFLSPSPLTQSSSGAGRVPAECSQSSACLSLYESSWQSNPKGSVQCRKPRLWKDFLASEAAASKKSLTAFFLVGVRALKITWNSKCGDQKLKVCHCKRLK